MEPHDATRRDESQLSFDDLSQLPLLSNAATSQTQAAVKKADAPRPKYEMNLAEFPLAFLTTRIPKEARYLIYEDEITGENGKKVPRKWKVLPHPEHGFLTPSGQSTLFELFQIWKESSFESQLIRFGNIYEIIKRKKLTQNDEKTYDRIRRDLDTLIGIIIEAENAFWDNEKSAYVDKKFHLFESLHLPPRSEKISPRCAPILIYNSECRSVAQCGRKCHYYSAQHRQSVVPFAHPNRATLSPLPLKNAP